MKAKLKIFWICEILCHWMSSLIKIIYQNIGYCAPLIDHLWHSESSFSEKSYFLSEFESVAFLLLFKNILVFRVQYRWYWTWGVWPISGEWNWISSSPGVPTVPTKRLNNKHARDKLHQVKTTWKGKFLPWGNLRMLEITFWCIHPTPPFYGHVYIYVWETSYIYQTVLSLNNIDAEVSQI